MTCQVGFAAGARCVLLPTSWAWRGGRKRETGSWGAWTEPGNLSGFAKTQAQPEWHPAFLLSLCWSLGAPCASPSRSSLAPCKRWDWGSLGGAPGLGREFGNGASRSLGWGRAGLGTTEKLPRALADTHFGVYGMQIKIGAPPRVCSPPQGAPEPGLRWRFGHLHTACFSRDTGPRTPTHRTHTPLLGN